MNRRTLAPLLLVGALLAGCGGYDDTVVPPPDAAAAAPAAPVTTRPCVNDGSEVRSFEPGSDLLDGPKVQEIIERGRLVAGVAADTFLLGARDPDTGDIVGFDIDMVNAVATEIFGTAENRVDFNGKSFKSIIDGTPKGLVRDESGAKRLYQVSK